MDKNLHILVIPSWYPEFEGDYVGSFFREQAIGLSNQNCNVGVIFPELKSLRGLKKIRVIPKLKICDDDGLMTYRFLWTNWFIKMKFLQIKAFRILGHQLFKKYIKENGMPDIIHCQSIFNAGFLGEFLSDKYKIPYLITEHNSGFYYKDQGFENFVSQTKRIIGKSSKCLAVSSNYAEYLNNLFSDQLKWSVHHNLVADIFLKPPIKTPRNDKFIFICISRLSKIKNIQLIIKSFKEFNDLIPNSELRLIGIGSEEKNLKQLAINLKVDNKVIFLGMKPRKEVVEEINSSHVLVYSSNFETFGVIFVESLALGRPVITTDCGSAREIINKHVGLISKKNDVNDMLSSMLEIHKNYNIYNPEKLREYCKEKFSERKISIKLINLYREILNNS